MISVELTQIQNLLNDNKVEPNKIIVGLMNQIGLFFISEEDGWDFRETSPEIRKEGCQHPEIGIHTSREGNRFCTNCNAFLGKIPRELPVLPNWKKRVYKKRAIVETEEV